MTQETIVDRPVREIAAAFRAEKSSPTELLELLLERISATEPDIRAYTTVLGDASRREAAAAEMELSQGLDRGLLHGIPVSVKDLIDTDGVRTTYGSSIFEDHVPGADATVVRKLKEAGAIIVGKTNTHEFAIGGATPRARNPFDLERVSGGSSGGSGAALAAGSAILALGTDTGGSIRIPASFCGVVGLKPTYGLVSRVGIFPESWSLDHIGPMARYVEDAAILLSAIAGYDPADPASEPIDVPDYQRLLTNGGNQLRVGVPTNHFFSCIEDDVQTAVSAAIDQLASCGLEVLEIEFPHPDQILAAYTAIDLAEVATNHRRLYTDRAESYHVASKRYIELGLFVRVTTYIDALRARGPLSAAVLEAMGQVDVLAVPTQPMVAPRAGEPTISIGGRSEDVSAAAIRFLAHFNLTGMPAASVCCGVNRSGLPIGLQIVGKPFEDENVLRVARAYESSTSWRESLADGMAAARSAER